MRRAVLASVLALALPLAAAGETATLLRDINTTYVPDPFNPTQGPQSFAVLGDRVVFSADDGIAGTELWVTDGTPAGTRILEDICPGYCSSFPRILGMAGDVAILIAHPGEDSYWRLRRSDGTDAGTWALDHPVGLDHPREEPLVFMNGALYFDQCSEALGCELWRSDGTAAGTRAVKTFVPRFNSGVGLSYLVAAGQRLYFVPRTDDGHAALWTSDGTAAGTLSLAEFGFASNPELLTGTLNGLAFFIQWNEAEVKNELWVSDGTRAGTHAVTEFEAQNPFLGTEWFKPLGKQVYFRADDVFHGVEIWRSDGTEKGTQRVTDFGFSHPFDDLEPGQLALTGGGRLVFPANDGLTPRGLWASSGKPESTAPLCADCRPEGDLVAAGGKVFFANRQAPHGKELWVTDGTLGGTRMVRDLCAGPCDSDPTILGEHQGNVLFLANDGVQGYEIWQSDGTAAGTRPVTDLPGASAMPSSVLAWSGNRLYHGGSGPGGMDLWVTENGASRQLADLTRRAPGSDPRDLTPLGDRLLFTACNGAASEIWTSTGTPEGTAPLPGHPTRSCGFELDPVAAGGRAFFLRNGQLWATDGTAGGLVQLTSFAAPVEIDFQLAAFQGKLFFAVFRGENTEIWKSDGTVQGTVKAFDLPGTNSVRLTAVGPELYFTALQTVYDLWRSDGTPAGTRKITNGQAPTEKPWFTRAGSFVYFLIESDLWKTDGTPGGTMRVRALAGFNDETPRGLVEYQGKLYFFSLGGELESFGWYLWRSDGTEAGTVPVRLVHSYALRSEPPAVAPTVFAERLFFTADDGEHGTEIWASDGTAAGTGMLLDLNPGAGSSLPSGLTVAGGRLFFAAHDGERGHELWSSDGTAAATRLVHDVAPEDLSSHPGQLTATASHLYFTADDGLSGRELWSLPLGAAGGSTGCQPSPRHLCLGGRYRVEAAWKDFQGNAGFGTAVAVTGDTGYFWFFSPTNVEVILKVLDGTGLNGHRWVFYGALSSVEYTLTVTDTQTGLSRRYFNPAGQLASVGDTTSFGPLGAFSVAKPAPAVLAEEKTAAAAPCVATAERLCLNNQRFAVEVAWKDFQGNEGKGKAVNLTADTGWFWFFDAANVEVVLKVLDGTALNGKHWVFYGALSSVEYTNTVTDTQTGAQKTYKNPSGRLASVADTGAF